MVGATRWLYHWVPEEGAASHLPISAARDLYFTNGFFHDASFPPPGPTMSPRYSADLLTAKLDHAGTALAMNSEISFNRLSSISLPRGMTTHLDALRARPEMR